VWTQSPEEQQHCLGKRLEVVVPIDLVVISHGDFPKHLGRDVIREKKKRDFRHFYSLHLKYPPKAHVLKAWSSGWHCYEVVETLRGEVQ
jgi:hypothetical protein